MVRTISDSQPDKQEAPGIVKAAQILKEQLNSYVDDPEVYGQYSTQEKHDIAHLRDLLDEVGTLYRVHVIDPRERRKLDDALDLAAADKGPDVLLPLDVLEVNSEVVQATNPNTAKELREALDAEYVLRLEDWSLEKLLEAEDLLLEQYRELLPTLPKLGQKRIEDPDKYRQWRRVADELRAVMVTRVARGVPFRDELRGQARQAGEEEPQAYRTR